MIKNFIKILCIFYGGETKLNRKLNCQHNIISYSITVYHYYDYTNKMKHLPSRMYASRSVHIPKLVIMPVQNDDGSSLISLRQQEQHFLRLCLRFLWFCCWISADTSFLFRTPGYFTTKPVICSDLTFVILLSLFFFFIFSRPTVFFLFTKY